VGPHRVIEESSSSTANKVRPFKVSSVGVFAIAVPMTLAYCTTPLLGLVDTGVVGRFGDASLLGGLAVGAIIFDMLFSTFNFLRSATTGLVAQAMGAEDEEQERVVCIRSLIIALIIGLVILALSPFILNFAIWMMSLPPAVAEATKIYFSIRVISAPLTLLNYSVLGWLLGMSRARTGLMLQLILNGTNIVLSLILGLYWQWSLAGVAWATVAAEAVAAVIGLVLFIKMTHHQGKIDWARVFHRQQLMRLMAVNGDIMIRSFCLLFAFVFFTAQGAQFGETTLAANAVLMNFVMVAGFLLDGFATAAEQIVGRAIGARYRPAFESGVRLTLIWGFILASFVTLLFFIFGPWLIDILTTNEDVRRIARVYMFWAALSAIIGLLAFQMDGIYVGATWSADMRNMMLLSLLVFFGVWYFASPVMGNHGLWLSLQVFFGVRGISLLMKLPVKVRQTFS